MEYGGQCDRGSHHVSKNVFFTFAVVLPIVVLPLLYVIYRKLVKKLAKQRIVVKSAGPQWMRSGDEVLENEGLAGMIVIDKHHEVLKKAEKMYAPLGNLLDYVDSLEIPDGIDFQSAVVTLLTKAGYRWLLPSALLLPKRLRKRSVPNIDGPYESLPRIFSPTILAALAQAFHSGKNRTPTTEYTSRSALAQARSGASDQDEPSLDAFIHNPFILSKHLPVMLQKLNISKDMPAEQTPEPRKISEQFFPGLYFGPAPGQTLIRTPYEIVICRLMCRVFNSLASNEFPAELMKNAEGEQKIFRMQLDEQSEPIEKPSDLLRALADSGHTIDGGICSHVTSFSYGLSYKDVVDGQERWRDIPIAIPSRTGIRRLDENNQVQMTEISTLVPHASFYITCEGPLVSFRTEFFQGISGFTGWFMPSTVPRIWQDFPEVTAYHGDWSFDDLVRTTRYSSHLMNVYNYIASKWDLPVGGYGYTGVCLDGIGLLQQVVKGEATIFPILVGGGVKTELAQTFELFAEQCIEKRDHDMFLKLLNALHALPCDVLIEPSVAEQACRRMISTLPSTTPFLYAQRARAEAARVIEAIPNLPTIYNSTKEEQDSE
mmetsp:Transcript_12960/g.39899  ORF Transcript_12960/g.39899 Transcript_12960/m.39899 type:complete len:601 (-) Transcript_12960:196-1998(-)|eukprot:CAMPEP_0198728696 /NCGR_PEP_ID=MMETSP1475-20131203/10970_1 /TAXON_ID= ORGANISM="Unidentified sp., Strain CCMP1999" /NCGR_SAMPLE_ID=MMETSP1475 /ASSEMBLY_ACC=CAM_ASM_001111 /LENGTH=600 /DNA_ID=CAMNT_0044491135 /DNA_START=364 /DNA_END=2166 /DNA_ORIENTATION=-